jgi:hypothetical protein
MLVLAEGLSKSGLLSTNRCRLLLAVLCQICIAYYGT